MFSNGNSFNGSSNFGASAGNAIGAGTIRWPVSPWKFGLRVSDDRGSI
jgi:hypothetical protein